MVQGEADELEAALLRVSRRDKAIAEQKRQIGALEEKLDRAEQELRWGEEMMGRMGLLLVW